MFLFLYTNFLTCSSLVKFKIAFKLVFIACFIAVSISLVNVCFPPIVASPADSALMAIYRDCIAQGRTSPPLTPFSLYWIHFIHSEFIVSPLDFTGSDAFDIESDSDLDSIPALLPHDPVSDYSNFRLGWSIFAAALIVIVFVSSK